MAPAPTGVRQGGRYRLGQGERYRRMYLLGTLSTSGFVWGDTSKTPSDDLLQTSLKGTPVSSRVITDPTGSRQSPLSDVPTANGTCRSWPGDEQMITPPVTPPAISCQPPPVVATCSRYSVWRTRTKVRSGQLFLVQCLANENRGQVRSDAISTASGRRA